MKLLLYCTKNKPYLVRNVKGEWLLDNTHKIASKNGKIVAECDYEVEEIYPFYKDFECKDRFYEIPNKLGFDNLLKESCLCAYQMSKYLGDKNGYAIHIKNLHIYDRPRDLFYYTCVKGPQNMQYVYSAYDENKNILISIRPEWLCKILNGEKTIEVRKKVLREMVEDEK